MSQSAEIFRHMRPLWFNKARGIIAPRQNGGLSFLFLPSELPGMYNYWIYICPEDTIFSARQAVSSLRDVVKRGIKPWGTITLSDEPILETAITSVIREENDLPSKAAHQAFKMMIRNMSTTRLHEMYVQSRSNAKEIYES